MLLDKSRRCRFAADVDVTKLGRRVFIARKFFIDCSTLVSLSSVLCQTCAPSAKIFLSSSKSPFSTVENKRSPASSEALASFHASVTPASRRALFIASFRSPSGQVPTSVSVQGKEKRMQYPKSFLSPTTLEFPLVGKVNSFFPLVITDYA